MSEKKYMVHNIFWKSGGFNINVLELNGIEDIEDHLTFFSKNKGVITKASYESWLVNNFILNNSQIATVFLENMLTVYDNINALSADLIRIIYDINPLLKPENIIINNNNVLKAVINDKEKGRPLMANIAWNKEKPILDPTTIMPGINNTLLYTSNPNFINEEEVLPEHYEYDNIWWDRLTKYVVIKKFKEKDVIQLVGGKIFDKKDKYQAYIIARCVNEFDKLIAEVDLSGMSKNVKTDILINELYQLVVKANPFLKFENINFDEVAKKYQPPRMNNPFFNGMPFGPGMPGAEEAGKQKEVKPKRVFMTADLDKLTDLEPRMLTRVVGQDTAVKTIVDSVVRSAAGLKEDNKPISALFFAGPTGIGKTHSVKVLAEELDVPMITLDCSEYSSDHEYSKLIGCHMPGSKVLMTDGSRKNIEDVRIDEGVITHKCRTKPVEFIHKYRYKGNIIDITPVNTNIPVRVTPNHEIFAVKAEKCIHNNRRHVKCKPTCKVKYCSNRLHQAYKPEWVRADSLKTGDIVFYPRYKTNGSVVTKIDLWEYCKDFPKFKCDEKDVWAFASRKIPRYIPINKDFMRLAGYYVSEGGNSNALKSINFTFNNKEHFEVIEVVKCIRKLFGLENRIRVENRKARNSARIWFSSRVVCNMMSCLFGHNVYTKKIPAWFKDLPDDLIREFLEAAILGDGCLSIERRVQYDTVSENLYSGMQLLLRRLGYITQTQRHVSKNPRWAPRFRIYLTGKQVQHFSDNFKLDVKDKDIRYPYQRMAYVNDDYICLQIRDIKEHYHDGYVHDLSVKDDVSYVVEIITHNSPPGFVGFDKGGRLTNFVRENPYSVILFDEVEKASHKIYDILLQIMEEASLTDGQGDTVDMKDNIIIMTSNIGVEEIKNSVKGIGFGVGRDITDEKKNTALENALNKNFKPEFLNRLDGVVYFNLLEKDSYMAIINLLLKELADLAGRKKKLDLTFSSKVKEFIYKEGIDEKYGARPLKRCIKNNITTPLAMKIVKEGLRRADIKVKLEKGKVKFGITERETDEDLKFTTTTGGSVLNSKSTA